MLSIRALISLFLLTILAACGGGATFVAPAEATVNGVTSLDRETGAAELSVSGLDANNGVVASGTLSNVSATVAQAGLEVKSGVCGGGQISALGPVVAALTFDASPSLQGGCLGCGAPTDPFSENGSTVRREGGLEFVARMAEDARAAVSYFNQSAGFVNVQGFTEDEEALRSAVVTATSPEAIGSLTPLWSASVSTVDLLGDVQGDNRIAIVFTDGQDTTSADPDEVAAAARASGVRVFYIGLGETTNVSEMIDIAQATEPSGLYVSARDRSELLSAFEGVINGSQASGCIDLVFTPVPSAGETVSGGLTFDINGGTFESDYEVTF